MSLPVIYMAHPFGGEAKNLVLAKDWLVWLNANITAAFIAPWIQEIELAGGIETAETRAAGLARCRATAARCHAVVAIDRISPGVRQELASVAPDLRWLYPFAERPADGKVFMESLVSVGDLRGVLCADSWNSRHAGVESRARDAVKK